MKLWGLHLTQTNKHNPDDVGDMSLYISVTQLDVCGCVYMYGHPGTYADIWLGGYLAVSPTRYKSSFEYSLSSSCSVAKLCLDSLQSDPIHCSLPGSSVHGILQTRRLEWVAMPSSRGSSPPRERTHVSWVSCVGRRIVYH